MIVADKTHTLTLTGNGDVLEHNGMHANYTLVLTKECYIMLSTDGIVGVGSGGDYALACARGLASVPNLDAEEIAKKSMEVAADLCVYTNKNFTTEVIDYSSSAETQVAS